MILVIIYKAAFLIPASAKKILDHTGWLFETEDRLQSKVLNVLKQVFLLEQKEAYLGVVTYEGNGIKASVIYDEAGLIEQISIQLWTRTKEELINSLSGEGFEDVEVFIP